MCPFFPYFCGRVSGPEAGLSIFGRCLVLGVALCISVCVRGKGEKALVIERFTKQTPCTDCVEGTIECAGSVSGSLKAGDCQLDDGSLVDGWHLELTQPQLVRISLTSQHFDAYLLLADGDCNVVDQNDDCTSSSLDSCLGVVLPPGEYFIFANSLEAGESGDYELTVVSCEEPPPPLCQLPECLAGDLTCGESVGGELAEGDCTLPDGSLADLWGFQLTEPKQVTVDMTSDEFDTYLILTNESCEQVAWNDDCNEETTNSCVVVTLDPGGYFVFASSFEPGAQGSYDLSLTFCEEPPPALCDLPECIAGDVSCDHSVAGELAEGDCTLPDGSLADLWGFELGGPGQLTITLTSGEFDAYLIVANESCEGIVENDDCEEGTTNSCVVVTLDPGRYFVFVNSFEAGEQGGYELSISCHATQALFIRGDANADGNVDIGDAIAGLSYLFSGGEVSCLDAADANDDGKVDIADPIGTLSYLFAEGDQPPAPFSGCGADPSEDQLGCEAFAPCGPEKR